MYCGTGHQLTHSYYLGYQPAWKRLPSAPKISPSANSKRSFQFLQAQLDTCLQEHKECKQNSTFLPTRVLDLGSSATAQNVRVFEPPSGTPGKYIALSYCWGDGGGLKANRANISNLLRAVDEDELPATILDAIELTKHLGVQYLWVDALCIVQDDAQDWVHESAQMSTVYAQAFLTISASSVASSRFSFLHQSRRNSEALFQLQENATSDQHQGNAADDSATILAVRRTPYSGFHQHYGRGIVDPSMCRAWTLQEYTLSTRVMSFSTDEMQWTCRTLRACECGNPEKLEYPRMEDLERSLNMKKHEDLSEDTNEGHRDRISTCLEFWGKVVEAYSRRDLSWMKDKLPALSGVAHAFSRILNKENLAATRDSPPVRYLAGLWDTDIHRQLCWRAGDSSEDGNAEQYRAPTWSWASFEGRVYTDLPNMNDFIPQAEILESVCVLANSNDPFGQVVREGTYLRVRSKVLETQMRITKRGPTWAEEFHTVYGYIQLDCCLEDIPLNTPIWGQHSAGRKVQRRRGEIAPTIDDIKQRASRGSSPGSDTGSDAEWERGRWPRPRNWETSNLGEQFTIWLLYMGDTTRYGEKCHDTLVLCRPAGDQEVYERIGHLSFAYNHSTWTEQVSKQEKSIATII